MIKIEINCEPDFLDAHIRALGFIRTPSVTLGERREVGKSPDLAEPYGRVADAILSGATSEQIARAVSEDLDNEDEDRARETLKGAKANPDRPWGQPSPGKKRRTGAEVAEDEAYLKAHPQEPNAGAQRIVAGLNEAIANVSTSEEHRDPAAEAQDAADEAAETVARKGDKLTLEDVRRAVAPWSEKVGPARAIKELRDILGGYALIDLPEAEWPKAIDNLEWAAANPTSTVLGVANGAAPELKVDEPKTGTKEDVLAAVMAYGKLYDGTTDPAAMAHTKEDLPKVFGKLFGASVTGLGSMPKTPEAFGQITAAIVAATRENMFKREVRS